MYAGIVAHHVGTWPNAIMLLMLAVLTVAPVGFIYPNLAPKRWKAPIMIGALIWGLMIAAMLPRYPAAPRAPAPLDFSISTPARAAQKKQFNDVTGTGYNSERITGPVNKADGLITGTPEFRHRDATDSQAAIALQQAATEVALSSAAQRLTGEGSQAGRSVTGDAWNAMSKVTGTEGASSLSRNLSARGEPRGMGMNALRFREEVEHPPVPDSRITGSAGNTGKGSLVTLSGGARG